MYFIFSILLSTQNSEHIYSICKKYELLDERASEIAEYVGQVLLGVLPPEDFPEILEKKVKLKKDLAKKVSQEINRFIFYPVKENLASLYKIEVAPPAKPPLGPPPVKKPPPPPTDVYREPLG